MLTVDRERRTIEGIAVPLGVTARRKMRLPIRYPAGSLTWGDRVHLLLEHNHSLIVGRAVTITESSGGLWAVFRVAPNKRGDWALELAATTHTGLSIGPNPDAEFRITHDGIEECVSAQIIEVSLTPNPVFA